MTDTPATPWLSILIPVYNVERYLADCVASVMAQVGHGVEVLFYEDASTDGSRALLQRLQANARIPLTVIWGQRNVGLSAGRNLLIEHARGDYLWLVDSDDLLAPGVVDALAGIVSAHAPELVISDYTVLEQRLRLRDRLRRFRGAQQDYHRIQTFAGPPDTMLTDRLTLLEGLYAGGSLQTQLFIAHRDVWARGVRFPVGRYFEDQATTPGLVMRARTVWYAPQPWYIYRKRVGSITTTMSGQKLDDCALAMIDSAEDIRPYLPAVLPARTALAVARFHAGNFIGISRRVARSFGPDRRERLRRFRQHFLAALPLPVTDLLRDHWQGGRYRKWFQLRWRLRFPT